MGNGADICYPKDNMDAYKQMQIKGGIISEYHLGVPPVNRFFPARNRIISGLSDALLVVEARKKSGTLITVDMALEQGREVYAVPGRISDRLSDGCNSLIKQGAGLALEPEDIIDYFYGFDDSNAKEDEKKEQFAGLERLTSDEHMVLDILDINPKSISKIHDELSIKGIEIPIPQMLDTLIHLVIKKYVIQDGSYYKKAHI